MYRLALMAALAATPAAAADSPLMAAFQKYCVATSGSLDKAKAAARADGYVAPPPAFTPSAPPNIKEAEVLWKPVEGAATFLMTGSSTNAQLRGDFCSVSASPVHPGAAAELKAWLGLPASLDEPQIMFTERGTTRRVLGRNQQRLAMDALIEGDLRSVAVRDDPRATSLIYIKLKR